ncbi:hypothetical protein EDD15DRAFT_956429 [Pisolithus albus]|nr:hypothetical protein EDD15DRAFT_956429 [Pisolithus albus]
MSVPPLLGRASPIRSTVQHSRGLTLRGDFHLERECYTTAPVYRSATVHTQEPQRLESSTGDSYRVSVAETLQLPGCPVIPAPLLVRNSSPVGYLSGEPGVARLSDYFVGESRASAIVSSTCDMSPHVINDFPSIHHTVATGPRRVTPTTTSRIMTPPVSHRTRVFHHLML